MAVHFTLRWVRWLPLCMTQTVINHPLFIPIHTGAKLLKPSRYGSALALLRMKHTCDQPPMHAGAEPLKPSRYGSALHTALGALAPLCSYLPLSVQQCNASTWAPKRDYDNNRLSR